MIVTNHYLSATHSNSNKLFAKTGRIPLENNYFCLRQLSIPNLVSLSFKNWISEYLKNEFASFQFTESHFDYIKLVLTWTKLKKWTATRIENKLDWS